MEDLVVDDAISVNPADKLASMVGAASAANGFKGR
jgi:hypothetical protein